MRYFPYEVIDKGKTKVTPLLGPLAFALGGPYDIAIVGVIVLLLFGGSKISGLGRAMGTSIREFKKAAQDEPEEATTEPTVTPRT